MASRRRLVVGVCRWEISPKARGGPPRQGQGPGAVPRHGGVLWVAAELSQDALSVTATARFLVAAKTSEQLETKGGERI